MSRYGYVTPQSVFKHPKPGHDDELVIDVVLEPENNYHMKCTVPKKWSAPMNNRAAWTYAALQHTEETVRSTAYRIAEIFGYETIRFNFTAR